MIMIKAFPGVSFDNWAAWQTIFPHIKAALAYRPVDSEGIALWAAIIDKAGLHAMCRVDYMVARHMIQQALEARENVLGKEHPDTLMTLSNLSLVLHGLKEYGAAEKMARHALKSSEKILGRQHPETLTSLDNLAGVL